MGTFFIVVLALGALWLLIVKFKEYWLADPEPSLAGLKKACLWSGIAVPVVSIILSEWLEEDLWSFVLGTSALALLIYFISHFMLRCSHCKSHHSQNTLVHTEFLGQEWRTETENNQKKQVLYTLELETWNCCRCFNSTQRRTSRKA